MFVFVFRVEIALVETIFQALSVGSKRLGQADAGCAIEQQVFSPRKILLTPPSIAESKGKVRAGQFLNSDRVISKISRILQIQSGVELIQKILPIRGPKSDCFKPFFAVYP